MKKVPFLKYLRENLVLPGESFVPIWTKLSDTDKADLRRYAEEEQETLGYE